MNFPVDTQETGNAERRAFKRVAFRHPVQFQRKDPARNVGALSCDISQGGLRMNVADFVPLNEDVALQVQMSLEEVAECAGRVVWVRQMPFMERYQLGLEFLDKDIGELVKSKLNIL